MTARRKLIGSGDYETSRGRFVEDSGYTSQVLFLVRLVKGTLPPDTSAGNGFLKSGGKLASSSARRAEQEILRALQPLVETGKIRDVKATVTKIADGTVEATIEFHDLSTASRRVVSTGFGG